MSVYYDPMLAKVIASAETRDAAIGRLIAALRAYPILGIRTNIPFLLRILQHPRFLAGEVDTGFLDGEGAMLAHNDSPEPEPYVRAAIAAHDDARAWNHEPNASAEDPWATLRGWRG